MVEQAGDQRRQRKKMQHIVAKIGKQRGFALRDADQIAERMRYALDDPEPFWITPADAMVSLRALKSLYDQSFETHN